MKDQVPQYDELLNPALRALHELGGSAAIQEMTEKVIEDLRLPDEVVDVPHGQGGQTELEYRLAWARTYLKNFGLINNSERGVWALTAEGQKTESVDPAEVVQHVREVTPKKRDKKRQGVEAVDLEGPGDEDWKERVLGILMKMDPHAFERLCKRILREAGFIEVEVTKRSGDGGVDGHGIIRVSDLISFPVLFQSKRYRDNVGAGVVRDFRGAMIGRSDKGLIITTGGFTADARREATRDGAPPIDLIDGDRLVEKLKELSLGVSTKMVEEVEVDEEWFEAM